MFAVEDAIIIGDNDETNLSNFYDHQNALIENEDDETKYQLFSYASENRNERLPANKIPPMAGEFEDALFQSVFHREHRINDTNKKNIEDVSLKSEQRYSRFNPHTTALIVVASGLFLIWICLFAGYLSRYRRHKKVKRQKESSRSDDESSSSCDTFIETAFEEKDLDITNNEIIDLETSSNSSSSIVDHRSLFLKATSSIEYANPSDLDDDGDGSWEIMEYISGLPWRTIGGDTI